MQTSPGLAAVKDFQPSRLLLLLLHAVAVTGLKAAVRSVNQQRQLKTGQVRSCALCCCCTAPVLLLCPETAAAGVPMLCWQLFAAHSCASGIVKCLKSFPAFRLSQMLPTTVSMPSLAKYAPTKMNGM